jgi:hypothetical protein
MYYAQIDENGIVIAVSQLSGLVDAPNLVEIGLLNSALLGKRYNFGAGQFEVAPAGPTLQPTPTMTQSEVEEQLLAQAEAIAALSEKINGGVA